MTPKLGEEIPELVKHPTTRQLVQYAGAQGDFYEIHYDQDFARSVGLPGVILHGLLKAAFLGQLVTDWHGDKGTLKTAIEASTSRGGRIGAGAGSQRWTAIRPSWRSGARTPTATRPRSVRRRSR